MKNTRRKNTRRKNATRKHKNIIFGGGLTSDALKKIISIGYEYEINNLTKFTEISHFEQEEEEYRVA